MIKKGGWNVRKKWKQYICGAVFFLFCLTLQSFRTEAASETIRVTDGKGTVAVDETYDGPQIVKIRVLEEGNFLEIYWDRYVDETEAVNSANFVLKNGQQTISLYSNTEEAWGWTNTLYFDRENKAAAAAPSNVMERLDPDMHMSSLFFPDEELPKLEQIATEGLTLEVRGDAIEDASGRKAKTATYTGIPRVSYYTKTKMSDTGIIVKADDTVAYSSLEAAAEQIDLFLQNTETKIAETMAEAGCSLAVYSPHQNVYLIPEHREWFSLTMYDVEGYGGNEWNNCVSSIAERNILRTRNEVADPYLNTSYPDENILIHEFGHCVKSIGLENNKNQTYIEAFQKAYENAKEKKLWPNTYAISNEDEFFATVCTVWFNVMSESADWTDGVRSPINTREDLALYDPVTYAFFETILDYETLPAPWDIPAPDQYKYNGKITKDRLKETLDASVPKSEEQAYTEDSWAVYEKALTAAELIYEDASAKQSRINEVVKMLKDAQENLQKAPETPPAEKLPFVDVTEDDWFYDGVYYNYVNHIVEGKDPTHFAPYENLARAQFAVILHRIAGKPEASKTAGFPDVLSGQWYTDAVLWAAGEGIIKGYTSTGLFGTADNITREQMAVMMYRYAGGDDMEAEGSFDGFTDADKVSAFAEKALRWAVGNGMITGKDNGTRLDPQGNTSRAECAIIIQRFQKVYG